MADVILLTNPDLNKDRVAVTTTASPRGRRGTVPVAAAGNPVPAVAEVSITGDAGDGLSHTVTVYGDETRPLYRPDAKGCTPTTVNVTEWTQALTSAQFVAGASVNDRSYLIVGDLETGSIKLKIYVISSDFAATLVLTKDTGVTVSGRYKNAQAVAVGGSIVIALGYSDTGATTHGTRLDLLRFTPTGNATGVISVLKPFYHYTNEETGAVTALDGFALSHDGTNFALFWWGGDVIDVFVGPSLKTPRVKNNDRRMTSVCSMTDIDSAWTVARRPFLTTSPAYGFVGGFVHGTAAAQARLISSEDGSEWTKFTDPTGAESTPAALGGTVLWSNGIGGAIAAEVRRLWIPRYSSGTAFGAPNACRIQHYDGITPLAAGWSDIDGDGADANTPKASVDIAAWTWRGMVLVAYTTSAEAVKVYRLNETSVSTTHSRELAVGTPQLVAGTFDHTRTALFATVDGRIREADEWSIATVYDFDPKNVLDELLIRSFRTDDGGTPPLLFNAGTNNVHVVDAVYVLSNLPAATFQMNDTDSWSAPTVSQALSAVVDTQTISSVKGNSVVVTGIPWKLNEHVRGRRWAKLSTGIFRILQNSGNRLLLDGAIGTPTGTVEIFGDVMSHVWSSTQVHQYARLLVTPAAQTPDDYYDVPRVLFGEKLQLPLNIRQGYTQGNAFLGTLTELAGGSRIPTLLNTRLRRTFEVEIPPAEDRRTYIDPVLDYFARAKGPTSQVALWMNGEDNLRDVVLVRLPAGIDVEHLEASIFATGRFPLVEEIA